MTQLFPIILAAGQGTRMCSDLPKVLHSVAGKPMLQHVIDTCQNLANDRLAVVYGHGGEQVKQAVSNDGIVWVLQAEQRGTGHAVAQAIDLAPDEAIVLVAYADTPLIRLETLQSLARHLEGAALSVLTSIPLNPTGYGRIVRDEQGAVKCIVEEKDADAPTKTIREINTGFMAARAADFKRWLKQLTPNNAQGEYYLTDCISLAVQERRTVKAVLCNDPMEAEGVNNRVQLARLERMAQQRQVETLMIAGVTVADPARLDIRGQVKAGRDCFIDINVLLLGEVELGDHVIIEPNCVIQDAKIGTGAHIKANSCIEGAVVGANCDVGPFARLRPGTVLAEEAKIGNFVETKKAKIGKGSKVSHLSYIGDTEMGEEVNIGAGTITCNYDGVNKFKTMIGNRVFVGSCSQLVAPVTIEDDATIGAGSTITKTAPAGQLTLARAKQMSVKGWQRPVKEQK
ncbi:MAG: bifunctional UDP-N-acetylglucosamine diphosphorylase/glucosamine-1-phosphate N-acetyltransferase GlmU [Thiolinea sp.]